MSGVLSLPVSGILLAGERKQKDFHPLSLFINQKKKPSLSSAFLPPRHGDLRGPFLRAGLLEQRHLGPRVLQAVRGVPLVLRSDVRPFDELLLPLCEDGRGPLPRAGPRGGRRGGLQRAVPLALLEGGRGVHLIGASLQGRAAVRGPDAAGGGGRRGRHRDGGRRGRRHPGRDDLRVLLHHALLPGKRRQDGVPCRLHRHLSEV